MCVYVRACVRVCVSLHVCIIEARDLRIIFVIQTITNQSLRVRVRVYVCMCVGATSSIM